MVSPNNEKCRVLLCHGGQNKCPSREQLMALEKKILPFKIFVVFLQSCSGCVVSLCQGALHPMDEVIV